VKKYIYILFSIGIIISVYVLKFNNFKLYGTMDQVYNGSLESYFMDSPDYIISLENIPYIIDKQSNKVNRLMKDPFLNIDTKYNTHINKYPYACYNNEVMYILEKNTLGFNVKTVNLRSFAEKEIYKEGFPDKISSFLDINNEEKKSSDIEYNMLNGIKGFFLIDKNIFFIKENKIVVYNFKNKRSKEILKDENIIGNNISCDGEYIYYINDEYYIMKYSLRNNTKEMLSQERAKKILLTSNGLLYTSLSNNHLYHIDSQGDTKREVIDKSVFAFNYDDEYIYYSNNEDNKALYKIKFNGSENKKLTNNPAYFIYIFSDYNKIYFMSDEDDKSSGEYVAFYSIDKDGNLFEKITFD